MCRSAAGGETPLESAGVLDFVFSSVWNRPGLSRRHRRLIALTCCGAADTVGPIEANVYAALKSGDLNVDELLEFVLHFAVYCGWPKASFMLPLTKLANQNDLNQPAAVRHPPVQIPGAAR